MNRWLIVIICFMVGLGALFLGLKVPARLRATDATVLKAAGYKTPTLVDTGLQLARDKKVESAHLLLGAAQAADAPGVDKLQKAVETREKRVSEFSATPFTEYIIKTANRENGLAQLQASANPGVRELLRTRALTNTSVFSASGSASGQAFDATVVLCGLLLKDGQFTEPLSNNIVSLASESNSGGSSERFEHALLDLMSLGQRLDLEQLTLFIGHVNDVDTLHSLTDIVRGHENDLPVIFSAVVLSREPALVVRYLTTYSQTGLTDLRAGLRFNAGGLQELLKRNQRFYSVTQSGPIAPDLALKNPQVALILKWSLYLLAGFLLGLALHFVLPPVTNLERPLEVRGFHVAREILFALGFLLVVLLLSEPFLAQESQKMDFSIRVQLPVVGSLLPAKTGANHTGFMNQLSLLTLLLFFVLQGLIYIACLLKLAEVRRQRVVARVKLRLLDNEEHLFDAGLYLGFVGTIISLILVSLGVIKPSLMAAYSSTSFGIIFVSVFKIFHLRPYKRILLLESESVLTPDPVVPQRPLSAPL